MIEISPDTNVTFFEAFARIVQASGLSQSEIARRANKRLKEAHQRMLAQIQDPAERILVDIARSKNLYIHRATINRAVRAIDSITPETLDRIALGLDLDEETLRWLKGLLEVEERVHHSTQSRVIMENGKSNQWPSWFDDEQPV